MPKVRKTRVIDFVEFSQEYKADLIIIAFVNIDIGQNKQGVDVKYILNEDVND